MEILQKYYKAVSLFIILVCGIISWWLGGVTLVFNDLLFLLTGSLHKINSEGSILTSATVVITVVFMYILLCRIVSEISSSSSKNMSHFLYKVIKETTLLELSVLATITIILEEVLIRWFFLGVMTKLNFLSGTTGFYVLFLVGNSIFALSHLYNYNNKKERKISKIYLIFIAGVLLTYVYVKSGLLIAITTHFLIDLFLFTYILSKMKHERMTNLGIW